MTLAADTNPENESNNVPALTAPRDTGVEPFIAVVNDKTTAAAAPRPFLSRLLDYSAHAAMIVGLVGFAWTVSHHIVAHPTETTPALTKGAALVPTPKPDEFADLRRSNQQMSEDIRHLHATLDALRASAHEDKTSAQVRVLQAGLENVQNGLTAARNETAQLNGKIDKTAHEPATKLQQLSERIGKLEKSGVDLTATASIPAGDAAKQASVPVPPAKPLAAKLANTKVASAEPTRTQGEPADGSANPQVISGYVVRDVYEGVALIEGRRGGTMEVVPGVGIPGAGVVKSIDRKGGGWTVTTTKGLLAYAAPPNNFHRVNRPARDYYPAYREDF